MTEDFFSRTRMVLGADAPERLSGKRVIVFGVGGVGGYVCEALARTGVGSMDLVDFDTVNESNLNRQIIATRSSIGRKKIEVMRERILDINPQAKVNVYDCFFLPEESDRFDMSLYDYVVDCIDTVSGKVGIITLACRAGIPVISVMGCAGKTDPTRLKVADIYKTEMDPLAKAVRLRLRKTGVKKCKTVFSDEIPADRGKRNDGEGRTIGSCVFVPAAAGMIAAGQIISELIK